MTFSFDGARVWVAGHTGMVGSALVRRLEHEPVAEVITATSAQLDLRRQADTEVFARDTRPDVLLLAAARVGGIQANRSAQADFLYDNLMITANAIKAAHKAGAGKVVVFGSSCVYPRDATQPMPESALLSGPPEETNEGYAIAKIAGLEMAKMFRRQHGADMVSVVPTNLYGPGDNFGLQSSHVLPALMRKVHEAKHSGAGQIELWGTGTPRREFMHVDDLADAVMFIARHHADEQHLNVGTGTDISIRDAALMIADVVGWDGELVFDTTMPDGMPRKLLDVSQLSALGWRARTDLRAGLEATYDWFLTHRPDLTTER